jgi:trigger factor
LHDPVVEDVVFRQGEPLRFKALLEIRPEIHLGQYRGLATVQPPGEASEEDISGALEKLRESAARYLPVEPRRVADGDHVIANVAGRFPDGDGEEFRHESVMIAVGAKENLTEFNEVLPGASPGEEKTFEVRYPADFGGKQLAGKRVEYALELRDIKRRELPALDDEFAHDLGVKEGLAALRAKVKSDLVEARRRQAAAEARESALRQLIEAHPFEVPDSLVERQLGRQMEEIVRSMLASGMKPPEVERLWGEMRERELPKARQRVRGMLLLDEIARQESLAVSDEEVVARIERDAKEMGVRPEVVRAQLEKQDSTQALKNQMLREKALDILLNGSRISA